MATFTRAELITAVLEELLVLGNGEDEDPNDTATVDRRVDAVLDDLESRSVCAAGDRGEEGPVGGEIEGDVFNHLVVIVAQWVAPKFGKPKDRAEIEFSESKLRSLTYGKGSAGRLRSPRELRIGALSQLRRGGR